MRCFQQPPNRRVTRPWSSRRTASLIAASLLLILLPRPASACGPFFPNSFLDGDINLQSMPPGDFRRLIQPLFAAVRPVGQTIRPDRVTDAGQQSIDVDMGDLNDALIAAKIPSKQRHAILDSNKAARDLLRESADPAPRDPELHAELPAEFALYLRGLAAWRRDDAQRARNYWQQVLDLDMEQRRYRTVWAAYMMGRSLVESNPDLSISWFHLTREFAQRGYSDNLGLAAASAGWEAQCQMRCDRYATAANLYLSMGEGYIDVVMPSLRMLVRRALHESPQGLAQLAADPAGRRIVTAYLVSIGGVYWNQEDDNANHLSAWLAALQAAGVRETEGGENLAWLSYRAGNVEMAERLLTHVSADTPIALWLRSRLLLRQGKLDEAAAALAQLAPMFPADEEWHEVKYEAYEPEGALRPRARIMAELGVVRFERTQYVDALRTLLAAEYWRDAAYIAERVLTPDELKSFVDREWGEAEAGDEAAGKQTETRSSLRHLLARRLTRIGRWRDARPYYPQDLRPALDQYIRAIRKGHDNHDAEALFAAAVIARKQGMELLGTELAPDWFVYGGSYDLGGVATMIERRAKREPMAASAEELDRLHRHAVEIDKRLHYRYTAADHAWTAASWMPDQDDRTARMLCIAGSWLKIQDPPAADRFYKALVLRCNKTELGRQAQKLRWFPKIKEDDPEE